MLTMIGSWRQLFLVGKKLGRLITPVKFVISTAMMSQPLLLIMIKGEPVFLEGGQTRNADDYCVVKIAFRPVV